MPRNFLRGVIFDLGGTLMYERAAWHSINEQADEALTMYLREQGIEINLSTFSREFRKRLDDYFKQREQDLLETTYSFVLRELLASKGYNKVSESLLRRALDRLFAVTQTNWVLEEDALPTSINSRRTVTVWVYSRTQAMTGMCSNSRIASVSHAISISSLPRPRAVTENRIHAFSNWRFPTGISCQPKR